MTDTTTPSPHTAWLAGLVGLTSAEADVFAKELRVRSLETGQEIPLSSTLSVVRSGSVDLFPSDGERKFATVGEADVLGEMDLFESGPMTYTARAASACEYISIDISALKHGFRYSHSAAVKWMVVFARSLSNKVRAANIALRTGPQTGATTSELRPEALDAIDLKRLQTYSVHKTFAAGDEVFAESDASEELYVIDEGKVDILRAGSAGSYIPLAHLAKGNFFGEMAFVDQLPRSARAVAKTDLVVHVLPAGTLDRMIDHSLGVGLYLSDIICKIMARRLAVMLNRVVAADLAAAEESS